MTVSIPVDLKAVAAALRGQADILDPPVVVPPVVFTPPVDPRFQLAITEDFENGRLSSNFWAPYDGVPGTAGVGTRKGSLCSFRDGNLVLACERPDAKSTDWNKWFSTGVAMGPVAQLYGRWEIEAASSRMPGSWPNIQLWPTAGKQAASYKGGDGWPKTVEVDILESPDADRSAAHSTIHYGDNNTQLSATTKVDVTQFHIYAVEWTPAGLALFIDGVPVVFTVAGKQVTVLTDSNVVPSTPHHLVAQTDMGSWAGKPTASDPTRMELVIKSIRQYKYVGKS